ncbi:alanine--tRNA ligase [Candidatus Saganbacteria bacterium CG08_land_8_20_14_0_20_45_16]|uniref:Alanine--tRNA ligase n=1 Tax=Candidatus Saganbacteria bacterium CG08_land_8_20_14_0_20_45_16 TaxID=2014293 RepID=A0A2H0XX84_UNCSA|nr:MAG: alanine--tRNA ligase [Candidatus Saganbacteria bacterium CG08_land_8_20_14_0_20_45_16]
MNSTQIRKRFLDYFKAKGHEVLPGSSLIPADPTVLLTLAGMLQFKPIFLGTEIPKYKRATTVQKCVRMIDLENVGKTARHQTFFEMLGNFSFGDYFKKEAIAFVWEFLTKELKIPPAKLSVAVFEKDDEAYDLWREDQGLPAEKLFRLDEENNFWAAGPTGPCGPCSEIYYDLGPSVGCGRPSCQPGCDCDRFLEVWNLVFIQYDRSDNGELIPLKQRGIDTGMGLERIASVLQGVSSNFETDLFRPLIQEIKTLIKLPEPEESKLRIIADHIRAVTHLVADGVLPGNAGREYVLRRLIRRALRLGLVLGIKGPFLWRLAEKVILEMGDFYPNLKKKKEQILATIKAEETNFLQTLELGMQLFNQAILEHTGKKVLPGEVVFKLHDTYGFPFELAGEMAAEQGYSINEQEFKKEMEKQRERARLAGISSDKNKSKLVGLDLTRFGRTKFDGYEKTSEAAGVVAVLPKENLVILDQSPFYAESGGQVGDTGTIMLDQQHLKVIDTLLAPSGSIVHLLEQTGDLAPGAKVVAAIETERRKIIQGHHTATHLLHKALQEKVGAQVRQAGSYVGPDKLRFDFSCLAAVSQEQLAAVEARVNEKIKEKIKVEVLEKSYQEAVALGAMALFGEKYGDKVRVLKIGHYSLELCGGTHVKSTEEIGFFKIIHESALGSGTRRIEAVAGQPAIDYVMGLVNSWQAEILKTTSHYQALMTELGQAQKGGKLIVVEPAALLQAIKKYDLKSVNQYLDQLAATLANLKEGVAKAERELKNLKINQAASSAAGFVRELVEINGLKVLTKEFQDYSMQMLRSVSDTLQNQTGGCLVILVSLANSKVSFLITVGDNLIAKGLAAPKVAAVFTPFIKGRGGGKANKVEGGGQDSSRLAEAFQAVIDLVKANL